MLCSPTCATTCRPPTVSQAGSGSRTRDAEAVESVLVEDRKPKDEIMGKAVMGAVVSLRQPLRRVVVSAPARRRQTPPVRFPGMSWRLQRPRLNVARGASRRSRPP